LPYPLETARNPSSRPDRCPRERTERLLQEHNVTGTLEALAESEGRAIARFKSFEAFRTRITEEGRAFFARIDQEILLADQIRLEFSSEDLRVAFSWADWAAATARNGDSFEDRKLNRFSLKFFQTG